MSREPLPSIRFLVDWNAALHDWVLLVIGRTTCDGEQWSVLVEFRGRPSGQGRIEVAGTLLEECRGSGWLLARAGADAARSARLVARGRKLLEDLTVRAQEILSEAVSASPGARASRYLGLDPASVLELFRVVITDPGRLDPLSLGADPGATAMLGKIQQRLQELASLGASGVENVLRWSRALQEYLAEADQQLARGRFAIEARQGSDVTMDETLRRAIQMQSIADNVQQMVRDIEDPVELVDELLNPGAGVPPDGLFARITPASVERAIELGLTSARTQRGGGAGPWQAVHDWTGDFWRTIGRERFPHPAAVHWPALPYWVGLLRIPQRQVPSLEDLPSRKQRTVIAVNAYNDLLYPRIVLAYTPVQAGNGTARRVADILGRDRQRIVAMEARANHFGYAAVTLRCSAILLGRRTPLRLLPGGDCDHPVWLVNLPPYATAEARLPFHDGVDVLRWLSAAECLDD